MQHLRTTLAVAFLATLCGAGTAQDESMSGFARLTEGEWRMTANGVASQFDVWTWGPGRHSVRNDTHGTLPEGDPWRVFDVIYWHPGRKELRTLGLHPHVPTIGRGVSEGAIVVAAERWRGEVQLLQSQLPPVPRRPRWLAAEWVFERPDRYRETLFEAPTKGAEYGELATWQYVHADERTPAPPLADEGLLEVTQALSALAPLIGGVWASDLPTPDGAARPVETTFAWMPLVEVVHARATVAGEHWLDAYVYHHPTRGDLCVLALTADGGVHEGTLAPREDGGVRLELASHVGERSDSLEVLLEPTPEGAWRTRILRGADAAGTPALDLRHARR